MIVCEQKWEMNSNYLPASNEPFEPIDTPFNIFQMPPIILHDLHVSKFIQTENVGLQIIFWRNEYIFIIIGKFNTESQLITERN